MDCSLSDSSVCGILQARILQWVAIPFSRGSSWPRDWTLTWVPCSADRFFTIRATREAHSFKLPTQDGRLQGREDVGSSYWCNCEVSRLLGVIDGDLPGKLTFMNLCFWSVTPGIATKSSFVVTVINCFPKIKSIWSYMWRCLSLRFRQPVFSGQFA